jgi:hypothetical protein
MHLCGALVAGIEIIFCVDALVAGIAIIFCVDALVAGIAIIFCVDALVAGIIFGSYSYKCMHLTQNCIESVVYM